MMLIRNKIVKCLCSTMLLLSLIIMPVRAETPKADHQPYMHGYNINDLLNWSPQTDLNAKYFRSRVPLADRISSFNQTQVNPNLTPLAQVMNLSRDYDKDTYEFEAFPYNDAFCRNLFLYWQYNDIYGSWHGLPVADSPTSPASAYDYGVINLPNPAYTAAAHRNGVKSLGCWFWPRQSQNFSDWVVQNPDGSFPVADKMIEMADYFGFEGYFINQEGSISSANAQKLLEMLKYLRAHAPADFHIQWYDSLSTNGYVSYQNTLNDANMPWIVDNGTPVSNSMFVNYWWNTQKIDSAKNYAQSKGLDPYEVVYMGQNTDMSNYGSYDPRLIFPEGGIAKTSWALFCTFEIWQSDTNRLDPSKQVDIMKKDRVFWSGPSRNVANTGRNSTYPKWDGVAHYIPARSVIQDYPFVTSFNTGHGKGFYANGTKVSNEEWSNAAIQEILPSWQWWINSTGTALEVEYDFDTAYNGGNSIRVEGSLGQGDETTLYLYKTKLPIDSQVDFEITYKYDEVDLDTHMEVGFVFEDQPNQINYIDVGIAPHSGWNTKNIPLNAYQGRTLAQVILRFSGEASQYNIHLGQIEIANSPDVIPTQPTGFEIETSYPNTANSQAELFLKWNFDSTVCYYDIYAKHEDLSREWLGRVYDEVYYVKHLTRKGSENTTDIELIAVNQDRVNSQMATTAFRWEQVVIPPTEIKVDLSTTFNGDGFSYDSQRSDGNYDHGGWCYSAELVENQLTNQEVTFDNTTYQLGSFANKQQNVIHCQGQTINITDDIYTSIRFLGSGTVGDQTGNFRINYTDGTYHDVSITQKDWCVGNTTGEKVVLQMEHRHAPSQDHSINNAIFAYYLTPDNNKQVTSIVLPNNTHMHIISMTLIK